MIKESHKISSVDDLVKIFGPLRSHFETGLGFPLKLEFGKYQKARSLNQNAALFGHAYKIIGDHTGMTVNEVHWQMCGEYFGWAVMHFNNRTISKPVRSTTTDEEGKDNKISTRDFAQMFEFVQGWGANHNPSIYIPDPDPDWREKIVYQIQREEQKQDND